MAQIPHDGLKIIFVVIDSFVLVAEEKKVLKLVKERHDKLF